MDLVFSVIF